MKRSDIGGLVAALGVVLLALGQTGGANFSNGSPFGTYLGLSSTRSTRLRVLGFGLIVGVAIAGVAIAGTVLHEVESDW